MKRINLWTAGLLAVVSGGGLTAQERIDELDLPTVVAEEVIDFFNRPSTLRFQGRAEIPEGAVIEGDVAVLGGPLLVGGEIRGEVIVVNGNLVIREGGLIEGDATVIGGRATGGLAGIGGQLSEYEEPLNYRRRGERIALDERPWARWRDPSSRGRSYISFRNEGNYNRVEGLPVMFGPVFRTQGSDHFRIDALGIWRSDSGLRLSDEELGYYVRAEQHFGLEGRLSIGGTAHSVIDPIERWGLRDIEASLTSFLLHKDYRDYFERQGFGVFLRYDDPEAGLRLGVEYRDEEHAYVPVGSPWTIKRNDAPWRPQPLIAEGSLRSVSAEIVVDDRNDPEDPSDGWYLAANATIGIGGSLLLPGYLEEAPSPATQVAEDRRLGTDVRSGFIDLRRYTRLGPGADIRLRGVLAGSLDGEPLPPQFQHALGGEGSLPGFPLMSLDCGARADGFSILKDVGDGTMRLPVFAGYGCDRVALFQAEYRGSLAFNLDLGPANAWDDEWDWAPVIDFTPSWSVFFNAGRGWTLTDVGEPGYLGPDTATRMDIGAGVYLGELGLFWAWPLNGSKAERNVNFFVRIDHRF